MSSNDGFPDRAIRATKHRICAGAVLIALVLVVTGCGKDSRRSADTFCDTMRNEKERILAQLEEVSTAANGQEDGFAGALLSLGGATQAIGELRTYFKKLSAVAPEEIRAEVEIVEDQFGKQMDSAGNSLRDPIGGLASSLMTGLAMSGQLSAVDRFARSACGESI